jgi:hypothetical protein
VELEVTFRPKGRGWRESLPERVKTDQEGRFRVEALPPGYEIRLSDGQGDLTPGAAPRAGETKALGDVRTKREED